MRAIVCSLLLLMLVPAAGCDRAAGGAMVSLRPPVRWEASARAYRERKDETFRNSPETPLLAEDVADFSGLKYWDLDARYHFVGPIHVHPTRPQFEIVTTAGKKRPCEKFGWIEFPLDGELHKLQVYRLLDQGLGVEVRALHLPFADGTTGIETYPAGRYVDLGGPPGEIPIVTAPDGRAWAVGPFVLDFNMAYNPSCAYGAPERFACPVTPPENRLPVRIEVGERGFKAEEPAVGG
jgi:uncharacterized protein (DUF1684 family)